MCGIIGYTGPCSAAAHLITGLRRLEYRGYDSAGIAVISRPEGGLPQLRRRRSVGPVEGLAARLDADMADALTGIGHTRWATHGPVTVLNAHPHVSCDGSLAIVHNGAVENWAPLAEDLRGRGHVLASGTDSELIIHLVEEFFVASIRQGADRLADSVRLAMLTVEGSHAVAVVCTDHPDTIVAARRGNAGALLVGFEGDHAVVASDTVAMAGLLRSAQALGDDQIATLSTTGLIIQNMATLGSRRAQVVAVPRQAPHDTAHADPALLREIREQPAAASAAYTGFSRWWTGSAPADSLLHAAESVDMAVRIDRIRRVCLVACGTPWHACLVGRGFMEDLGAMPTTVEYAHEFAHRRNLLIDEETLVVVVSQSGETADSLLALKRAKALGSPTIVISNVEGATATRLADASLPMRCGPEFSVAQTKAFTSELMALMTLACMIARQHGRSDQDALLPAATEFSSLSDRLARIVSSPASAYQSVVDSVADQKSFLFLGRGQQFPIAMEGALKLKELSYVHAEGYPAGEMKHGPIALVHDGYPVVAIVARDHLRAKMLNQLAQVRARGAHVIAVISEGDDEAAELADNVLCIPNGSSYTTPMLSIVPLQLFAFYFARTLGRDLDRPRNLAKSVTVE
jgi:glucosamine--fructose-6-phosphate aminotransferase (isomerizing)